LVLFGCLLGDDRLDAADRAVDSLEEEDIHSLLYRWVEFKATVECSWRGNSVIFASGVHFPARAGASAKSAFAKDSELKKREIIESILTTFNDLTSFAYNRSWCFRWSVPLLLHSLT